MQTERTFSKRRDPTTSGPPLLSVEGLSVSLGGNRILKDINVQVKAGTIHALVGPNGAGKTTLIRSILGAMPHEGTIRFRFSKDGRIGYVPQLLDFDHSVPITVGDFIAIMLPGPPVFIRGIRKIRTQVEKILAATQCDHLVDRLVGSLSGGEFRRVLLAQALVPLPEMLLLDEPASNVDESGARLFEAVLCRLRDEHAVSILMVGHDMETIRRIADHVTRINYTVTFDGAIADLATMEDALGLSGVVNPTAENISRSAN